MGEEKRTLTEEVLDGILPPDQIKNFGKTAAPTVPDATGGRAHGSHAAQADVEAKRSERRLNHGGSVIIPEQVVASGHQVVLATPLNLDPRGEPATVKLWSPSEADEIQVDSPGFKLPSLYDKIGNVPQPPAPAFTFTYTPRARGPFHTRLWFSAWWPDGHKEELSVLVFASARELSDPPASSVAAEPHKKGSNRASEQTLALFDTKSKHLANHLGGLADHQIEGLHVIKEEAAKYVAPPPEESIWVKLAELAVVIGTAGVASMVGKYVATKLVGILAKPAAAALEAEGAAAGASAAKAVAGHAGHTAAHAAEHGAAKVAHDAEHAAHEGGKGGGSSHLVLEGLATSIEDGIKSSVEGKFKFHHGEAGKESEASEDDVSDDPQIQFFASQEATLRDSQMGKKDMLDDMIGDLRNIALHDPTAAIEVLENVQAGFDDGASRAARQQANATAAQWVAFVAQGKLGSRKVGHGESERDVSKLESLRKLDHVPSTRQEVAAKNEGGVLEIVAAVGDHGGVRVLSAELDGISRLIGDRLLRMDLRTAGIPVRIRFGVADVITVDEAGSVRTSSHRSLDADVSSASNEAQRIRGAEHIVAAVYSKTLAAWGIAHVRSDDKAT